MTEGVRPLGSSLTLSVVVAVPGEVGGVGAQGGLGRERELLVVKVGQFEVAAAGKDGFGYVGKGHADAEVIIDGPEACVEKPMGCRGQGQAVIGGIRPSLGVGVDVGGL